MKKHQQKLPENNEEMLNERRDFLRKSAYFAYSAPIVMHMLVNNASAAQSCTPGRKRNTVQNRIREEHHPPSRSSSR